MASLINNLAEEYNSTKSYIVGDVVTYDNKLYLCIKDTSGSFNASFWQEKYLTDLVKGTVANSNLGGMLKHFSIATAGNGASYATLEKTITINKYCNVVFLIRYETTRNGQGQYPSNQTTLTVNDVVQTPNLYEDLMKATGDGKYDGAGARDLYYFLSLKAGDKVYVKATSSNWEMYLKWKAFAPEDFSYT